MKLKEYFGLVWKSLNPNKHREMAELSFFDLSKYFSFLVLLCVLASLLIMLPMLTQYDESLNQELSDFKTFSLGVNASLDESITLLDRPKVVVDFDKENMTDEFVLVNDESVMYKKFIFFGEEEAVFSDYRSVKSEKSASLYSTIFVFFLPALLFWIVVLFLVKYAVLISVFSVLGWVFFISSRNEVSYMKSLKTAVFTATPMVVLDLVLWPITILFFIPLLLYIIYFLMGLVMVSDRKYKHKG